MANIRLKELVEANVDPKLVARSKESGKLVYFKTPQAKDAALKAGSHLDPKAEKGGKPNVDAKPNDMFGADYKKDRGGEAPKKDVDISDYSTDGTSAVLYKGKKVGDYMYDDITDEFTLKTKDGIKAFDSHADMYNYIEKNKNGGGEAPKADKPTTSKYDDKSYWKDDERSNTQGYTGDDDSEDDNSWGDEAQFTSDRLSKIEDALKDDLNLRGNGFETTRESGGGMGGFEGPMTIVSKDADYNDEDNYISLSVGSPNNDGKFSIVFANANGEPHFEPNYDALTGDNDLEPQQAYKVTKALMKMPEVQKVLKGEMKLDEFKPIYDKLKSKFSKTESTKLTSMIKR
jgi:hypothetical protein